MGYIILWSVLMVLNYWVKMYYVLWKKHRSFVSCW